ncbi:MAG: hypothetical protein N2053_01880 [Chitinispirillaceae bacterium]|nr:hypothetical protein [Chitinispirillaceae bacterium]
MGIEQNINISVDSIGWQDYRASNTGMVIFYSTDPVSELPIREIPEELPTDVSPDPNYETGTYGLFGCGKIKIKNSFVRSKIRNLFFLTKYAGTNVDYKDRYFITGWYHINKIVDAKKLHIRYLSNFSCLEENSCYAMRADIVRFVSIEDSFEVTEEVLKSWNYDSKITKQTKILLDEKQASELIEYLKSKQDITQSLISETERLWPHTATAVESEE